MGCGAGRGGFTLNPNPTLPAFKTRPVPIRPAAERVQNPTRPGGVGTGSRGSGYICHPYINPLLVVCLS